MNLTSLFKSRRKGFYNILIVAGGLAAGMAGINLSPLFLFFIKALKFFVPGFIFLIICGAVGQAPEQQGIKEISGFMVAWFLLIAFVAGLFAGVVMILIFPSSLIIEGISIGFGQELKQALGQVSVDPNFIGILAGIATGIIAHFSRRVKALVKLSGTVLGKFIGVWRVALPALLFLGGNYIGILTARLGQDYPNLLGTYIRLSLLMAGIGFGWQLMELLIIKIKYQVNLKQFFRYYLKVFPFAWSTCSESISIPVNLDASKELRYLSSEIKKVSVILGGALNTPGSVMCGVIFGIGIPALVFNLNLSLIQLLLITLFSSVILGASPGVPGELVLLTGLMLAVLDLPSELTADFIAIWVAFQMGIPDGFRTAVNVTDDQIYASIFEHLRKKRLALEKKLENLKVQF